MKHCCGNCRAWEWFDEPDYGVCHRHAPSPQLDVEDFTPVWPITEHDWWCGEWLPETVDMDDGYDTTDEPF